MRESHNPRTLYIIGIEHRFAHTLRKIVYITRALLLRNVLFFNEVRETRLFVLVLHAPSSLFIHGMCESLKSILKSFYFVYSY